MHEEISQLAYERVWFLFESSLRGWWEEKAAVHWTRLPGRAVPDLQQRAQHHLAGDCQLRERRSEEAGGQPKACPSWYAAHLLLDTSICQFSQDFEAQRLNVYG